MSQPGARAQAVGVVARIFCCPTGEARVDLVQQAIQAAVEAERERCAKVAEQQTLQAIAAEQRWREKHAMEEIDGVAKSERAECSMTSLGLVIMQAISQEGGPSNPTFPPTA